MDSIIFYCLDMFIPFKLFKSALYSVIITVYSHPGIVSIQLIAL